MSSVHRGLRRWSQWHSCRRYSTILLKSKYCKAVKALCKLSGELMLTSKCGSWFPSFNRKIKTDTCVFMNKACGCKPSKVIMWGNVIAIGWMKARKNFNNCNYGGACRVDTYHHSSLHQLNKPAYDLPDTLVTHGMEWIWQFHCEVQPAAGWLTDRPDDLSQ